jgi:hypothetical protein
MCVHISGILPVAVSLSFLYDNNHISVYIPSVVTVLHVYTRTLF